MGCFYYILQILFIIFIISTNGKYQDRNVKEYESNDVSSIDSLSNELLNSSVKMSKKDLDLNIVKQKSLSKNECGKGGDTKNCPNTVDSLKEKLSEVKSKSQRYPFTASIQRKGVHYSTGALLSKRWVITVAREFYNVRESIKFFRVRLGTVNCKKGGTLIPIKSVEIHPSYEYKNPRFDVALLQLAMPVEYSENLQPISFSKITGKVLSAKFMTTYWPRLIVNGRVLPPSAQERVKMNSMRVSTQKMIPWNWCHNVMSSVNQTLDESSLCLDPIISHHSPCLPDAGAPVTADDGLWGITSGWTSENCLEQHSPTIFTRISSPHLRSWLLSQMDDV